MSTLQANIAARQEAESLIDLIGPQPPRFWEVLAAMATAKLPAKEAAPAIAPMDDLEAQRFENVNLQWGKHAGSTVGECPVSYLLFLAEGDEFTKKLRRYTASKVFAQRQDDESE